MTDADDDSPAIDGLEPWTAEAILAAEGDPLLPPDESIESHESPTAVRGAVWTLVGFGAMQALRFGFNVLLTHLLAQTVFGVMALVNLCIQGLHMFSDIGIRQCVVNSKRGDEERFLDTAWTLQVGRGLLLWGAAVLLAWPLARFYGVDQLRWLIPIVGATAFCDGLNSTAALTLTRRLQRGRLVFNEVFCYLASMSLVAGWLWLTYSPNPSLGQVSIQMLAFAAGNVFSSLLEAVLSFTLIRGQRNRFAWDPVAASELMHFGGWIFVSTALTFLAGNLDRLCAGKLDASMHTLANYNAAAMLARVPTLLLVAIAHQVVFPLYSRLNREGGEVGSISALVHAATNGVAGYLVAGVIAVGPPLVWLVYDERYVPAGHYLQGLGLAAWFTVLQTGSEVVLLSLGRTRQIAIGQGAKLVLLVPLLMGGYYWMGVAGFIAGYVVAEAARYLVLTWSVARAGYPVLRIDLALTALLLATVAATTACQTWLSSPGRPWLPFVGSGLIMSSLWLIVLAAWWPRHGQKLLAVIHRRAER